MVTENVMVRESQTRGDLGYGYDSRYVKVVAVLDEVLKNAENGHAPRVEAGLQHLLRNSLEQVRAENSTMQAICFPDRAEHEIDHFRICTTIAGLCCRWSRSRNSLNDLHELRDLVSRHISRYDRPFEHYLLA